LPAPFPGRCSASGRAAAPRQIRRNHWPNRRRSGEDAKVVLRTGGFLTSFLVWIARSSPPVPWSRFLGLSPLVSIPWSMAARVRTVMGEANTTRGLGSTISLDYRIPADIGHQRYPRSGADFPWRSSNWCTCVRSVFGTFFMSRLPKTCQRIQSPAATARRTTDIASPTNWAPASGSPPGARGARPAWSMPRTPLNAVALHNGNQTQQPRELMRE
jgi:hypothetical protein